METFTLPKRFFKENPLEKLSAAAIFDFTLTLDESGGALDAMQDGLDPLLGEKRKEEIRREQDQADAAGGPEEIVNAMRKISNPFAVRILCGKALADQANVMPLLLRRYRTSSLDHFLETAARCFCRGEARWAEELLAAYPRIRDPYAQSLACLVFGERRMTEAAPLLLAEYRRLTADFPERSLGQGPLLGLYILHGRT